MSCSCALIDAVVLLPVCVLPMVFGRKLTGWLFNGSPLTERLPLSVREAPGSNQVTFIETLTMFVSEFWGSYDERALPIIIPGLLALTTDPELSEMPNASPEDSMPLSDATLTGS